MLSSCFCWCCCATDSQQNEWFLCSPSKCRTFHDRLVASWMSIRCSPSSHQTNCFFFLMLTPNVVCWSETATKLKIATHVHQSCETRESFLISLKQKENKQTNKANRWWFWTGQPLKTLLMAAVVQNHQHTCPATANYFHKYFRCSESLLCVMATLTWWSNALVHVSPDVSWHCELSTLSDC